MSRADELYIQTCKDILENGFYDTDLQVRPHWEDGTPAHTVKKFGVVNRYNLKEEFPLMTLRRTYWKSALDELLWIWQKKSNRVCDLGSHVWDEWAGEDGIKLISGDVESHGVSTGIQVHLMQIFKIVDIRHDPAGCGIVL